MDIFKLVTCHKWVSKDTYEEVDISSFGLTDDFWQKVISTVNTKGEFIAKRKAKRSRPYITDTTGELRKRFTDLDAKHTVWFRPREFLDSYQDWFDKGPRPYNAGLLTMSEYLKWDNAHPPSSWKTIVRAPREEVYVDKTSMDKHGIDLRNYPGQPIYLDGVTDPKTVKYLECCWIMEPDYQFPELIKFLREINEIGGDHIFTIGYVKSKVK